tara:strand:- start:274 stop:552 length:279 start_codon:yes stop_codon:yes gene_type:complete
MKEEKDPITLIDWWRAINYLPIGSKLISLIKSRRISEKDSKLLGVTDQDIYFAKKRVYMKEGDVTITRIEDSIKELELTWTDIKNYQYATVL